MIGLLQSGTGNGRGMFRPIKSGRLGARLATAGRWCLTGDGGSARGRASPALRARCNAALGVTRRCVRGRVLPCGRPGCRTGALATGWLGAALESRAAGVRDAGFAVAPVGDPGVAEGSCGLGAVGGTLTVGTLDVGVAVVGTGGTVTVGTVTVGMVGAATVGTPGRSTATLGSGTLTRPAP
jgi:hypothetical protein